MGARLNFRRMPVTIPGFPEPVYTFEEANARSTEFIKQQAEILRQELRAQKKKQERNARLYA